MATNLQARLQAGDFVVTAEITPPVSTDPAEFLSRALPLKGVATAVNVTDGAGAKVHLSSLAAAHFLVQNGIEPIVQMTCRDRNRLALQGDILGAESLGIRNMLMLAGDDPKAGDQPEAKAVFDLDSKGLLAMADRMRRTRKLPSGTEIAGKLDILLGAADTPIFRRCSARIATERSSPVDHSRSSASADGSSVITRASASRESVVPCCAETMTTRRSS
jgi:methylenetetrahydrofolate reductase (NADPH)